MAVTSTFMQQPYVLSTQRKGSPSEQQMRGAVAEGEKSVFPNQKPRRRRVWNSDWEARDVFYGIGLLFLHLLSLLGPFTFTWGAFWVFMVLYLTTSVFGVTLSYHRNLAHKSFKLPKYLEYTFAYFGLHALQGDPMFWVSTHRYHHKFVDTDHDPHSPNEGFFFSHFGWLLDHKYIRQKAGNGSYKNVGDMMRQPYYRFLRKTFVHHFWLLSVALYLMGGFPFFVWGMGVRTVWTFHLTWIVNSGCHTWGRARWNTGDLSKNNWWIALLTFGEGWHNNHHAFEYSARQGIEWWEIDVTYYMIKALEYVGLATDVKVPSKLHMEKMSLKKEVEDTKPITGDN